MRSDLYQYALIALGAIATLFFGVFFYREIFPEYKIYQEDYMALEKFRSTYTHEPPPVFNVGVKQILLERSDKGNPTIDRCTSCHVALQFPHFSPTTIAHDLNGQILRDKKGRPLLVPNEAYVFDKLDSTIAELEDEAINENLRLHGEGDKVSSRLREAGQLKSLKIARVGDSTYDMTKVLSMHPLMGKETRPFEYHPIEEYGCTSCHSGNGRGLTTIKAHGPVFDGEYEKEFIGFVPQFTESDPDNDPRFSKIFNGKPSDALLFQTEPLLIGGLIQAKCAVCHTSSKEMLQSAVESIDRVTNKKIKQISLIETSFENDKKALFSLYAFQQALAEQGQKALVAQLEQRKSDYTLTPESRKTAASQLAFLSSPAPQLKIQQGIEQLVGAPALVEALALEIPAMQDKSLAEKEAALDLFLQAHRLDPGATGALFVKFAALALERSTEQHIKDIDVSFAQAASDNQAIGAIASEIDLLTYNYQRGERLFISQGCFACHRIAGLSRGGVGPELTHSGEKDPWFVKQSIVWPQADLATSTMPNFGLDHEELQDLVTFLLGQHGEETKAHSQVAYKTALQDWEAGRRLPWEQSVSPSQIRDLRYGMEVFATEGCASCHRLQGFEANVGFAIEKNQPAFGELYKQKEWFKLLFPEEIVGSEIIRRVDAQRSEIDQKIVDHVRSGTILHDIEQQHPTLLETFYTPFKFAKRAKNHHYEAAIATETDVQKKALLQQELQEWQARIHRLMLMFAQEYGLGRLICPRPNWSGIFRSDEWLMEHFKNPTSHTPRSLMPVFPFDESKFYALTYMLDQLAIINRNATRAIWKENGFNPALAFQIHCSQCHGDFLQGNGPIAPWIYPIPKNLQNGDFLRNLTREQAIASITHGVKGTPMPPWGEVAPDKRDAGGIAVLTEHEIARLVDWIFSSLPGGSVIRGIQDVPKWNYTPEDFIQELQQEGGMQKLQEEQSSAPLSLLSNSAADGLLAAINPISMPQNKNEEALTSEIFDIASSPVPGGNPLQYYIKRKYYTPENIQQGRYFFEINCAICHGKEADGSGLRAGTMSEAKPRMLTNLDWIKTRDDLRLLRSIKYGVAGTAMTPWGDLTSALQRMQLVMFIRNLTENRFEHDLLTETLYQTFNTAEVTIEKARGDSYVILSDLQSKYQALRTQREALYRQIKETETPTSEILSLYDQELKILAALKKREQIDARFLALKAQLKQEKDLYLNIGAMLLQNGHTQEIETFISMVSLLKNRFTLEKDKFSYEFSSTQAESLTEQGSYLLSLLSDRLEKLKKAQTILLGKISSVVEREQMAQLKGEMHALSNLKNDMTSAFSMDAAIRQREQQLVEEITKGL